MPAARSPLSGCSSPTRAPTMSISSAGTGCSTSLVAMLPAPRLLRGSGVPLPGRRLSWAGIRGSALPFGLLRRRPAAYPDSGSSRWRAVAGPSRRTGCTAAQSNSVCVAFQQQKGLAADGKVGPVTWHASWADPVT